MELFLIYDIKAGSEWLLTTHTAIKCQLKTKVSKNICFVNLDGSDFISVYS